MSREKRAAEAAKGALEVDLKAVLARHAREVDAAAGARREAGRAAAARAAAEAEIGRLTNQVDPAPSKLSVLSSFRIILSRHLGGSSLACAFPPCLAW